MVISQKIVDGFNEQIRAEFYSGYLYLQMAAWFEEHNLPGFANWMRVQRLEEQVHGMKFYNHLAERGARIELRAIDAPATEWKSPLQIFEAAYGHEQKITAMINRLVELAAAEKDYPAQPLLQWFVTEQVEEEASTSAIAQQLKMVGDGGGLFMIDRQLATRVFNPPAGETGAPSAAPGA